jgi:hypothetical protein
MVNERTPKHDPICPVPDLLRKRYPQRSLSDERVSAQLFYNAWC